MTLPPNKSLLPAGLSDILPPHAAVEADAVERMLNTFAAFGYERVKPPLMEYENTLLADIGATPASQAFRVMDPMAQRMLSLRPDMTMQVARVAATRLAHRPRPLRLSYAGEVVRVRSSQLRAERQFGQVGAELVGTSSVEADVEVISMAAESLIALGVENLTVDLGAPWLVPSLLEEINLSPSTADLLREALDRKDIAAIAGLAGDIGEAAVDALCRIIRASGPADDAIPTLEALDLASHAAAARQRFVAMTKKVATTVPAMAITVDITERRGHEYYTEMRFSLFSRDIDRDLGRGGRYLSADGESATGVTLFMSTILSLLSTPPPSKRIFLPFGTSTTDACMLRSEGWITIAALEPASEADAAAALRLGCTHLWREGRSTELSTVRNT